MRSIQMMTKTAMGVATAALVLAACGAEAPATQGRLRTPETGHTRMTLAPALDVSSIVDPALLERLVIDEVVVNVQDVRLLGADPRLPTGGLRLLAGQRQVSTLGDAESFPLPAGLSTDDLALFVRLQPSPELGGASVIVRARLYATARDARMQTLLERQEPDPEGSPAMDPYAEPDPEGSPAKTDPTKEPDPEGSPAKTDPTKEPDPEGSPARGGGQKAGNRDCEPDPEGSPAIRRCKAYRQSAVTTAEYVPFELRGSDMADLLVGLAAEHPFDVVLGVPAARWLTPDAIVQLETELSERVEDVEEIPGDARDETVVVSSKGKGRDMTTNDRESNTGGDTMTDDDYRLLGRGDADPDRIRKH